VVKNFCCYLFFCLATLDLLRNYSTHGQTQTVLEASIPSFIGSEQVNRLFDLVPGLECCNCDPSSGKSYQSLNSFFLISVNGY
jgi:hypothetical protein